MTAEDHNRTLATLHLVYGAMHGLGLAALVLVVLFSLILLPGADPSPKFWVVFASLTVVVSLFVWPPLVVGYGLLKRKAWAKPLGITSAVISLVNLPLGTALSIYAIRFFQSEGGRRLYGGKEPTTSESELQDALRRAQPLMNRVSRVK
ncbi:MAG TPA: hypothetical protein VNB49_09290 [Candidatus Dormibacteraeota bacterium]|nr:hypothetical protein [Candidatus Dormibacteraeota bacterium]